MAGESNMAPNPENRLHQNPISVRNVQTPRIPKWEPKTHIPTLNERLRLAAAGRVLLIASALTSGGLATQHHIEHSEPISPAGITNDIKGIVPTAQKDIDALFNTNLAPKKAVSAFDNNNLKSQHIAAGPYGNAEAATDQQIQDFINKTTPILKKSNPGEAAPVFNILLPLNPANATDIVVNKEILDQGLRHNIYQNIETKGKNVPFYLPLVEGSNRVTARVVTNMAGISDIQLHYHLNNGQEIDVDLAFGNGFFAPTEIMKSIPTYDTRTINTQKDIAAVPTKEFDLSQNPHVVLFQTTGPLNASISSSAAWNGNMDLNPNIATNGTKVQFISSTN